MIIEIICLIISTCLTIISGILCSYCQKNGLISLPAHYWLIGFLTATICWVINFIGVEISLKRKEKE